MRQDTYVHIQHNCVKFDYNLIANFEKYIKMHYYQTIP